MTDKSKKFATETVTIDDVAYETELTVKYKNRKSWSSPDNRKITGFLPGTVTHVLVKKGEQVREGQTLIKFEAMKMVNNVQTSVAGKVKEICVKIGDRFPKGFVLVELE